jgi:hypothetical protein
MYKRSKDQSSQDIFGSFNQVLPTTKSEALYDPNAWFNQFYLHFTSKIDESIFERLYPSHTGRPNASVKTLVGMIVLKEGHNWSDEQMHASCQFDMRIMRALGFNNVGDSAPVLSTYYDFKDRLAKYYKEHQVELIGEAFDAVTSKQVTTFKVKGEWIRWDSKLFSSNIARCTRLQLIINVIQHFWKAISEQERSRSSKTDQQLLNELLETTSSQQTYRMTNEEKAARLKKLGLVALRLRRTYAGHPSDAYKGLCRLVEEQYNIVSSDDEGNEQHMDIEIKDKGDITGATLQSPYDHEATNRRKKNGEKEQLVHGYSANITETCNDEGLNLVTAIQVETAVTPDCGYVMKCLEKTQEKVGEITYGISDGAYHSPQNRAGVLDKNITWYTTGISGEAGAYSFEIQAGQLMVTNLKTEQAYYATENTKAKGGKYKYTIKEVVDGKKVSRYFQQKQIDNYFIRKQIEALPEEIRNKRPNVESTIHAMFYTLRGQKSKYRGLEKNMIYVYARGLWTNFRRISQFITKTEFENALNALSMTQIKVNYQLGYMLNWIVLCFENLQRVMWLGKNPIVLCEREK